MNGQKFTDVIDAIIDWDASVTPMPAMVKDFLSESQITSEYISEIANATEVKQKLEVASKIYNLKTINAINLSRGIVNGYYNKYKGRIGWLGGGLIILGFILIGFQLQFFTPLITPNIDLNSKNFLLLPGFFGMLAWFFSILSSIGDIFYLLKINSWKKQHPEIAESISVGLEKKQMRQKVIPTNNNTELRDKRDDQKAQGKGGSERDPLSGHDGPPQGQTEPPVISEKEPMKETTHSQKYLIIGGVGTALLILSFYIPYSYDKLDLMSPYYNIFGLILSIWGSTPFILIFYLVLVPLVIGIVGSIVGLYLPSYKVLMVAGIVSIITPINMIILVDWGTLEILWVIMSILGSILLIISGLITRSNIQSITSS